MKVHSQLVGFVASVTGFGVFVRFLGQLSALAPKHLLADSIVTDVESSGLFAKGQTVSCVVTSVDAAASRAVVSLRPSDVARVTSRGAGAAAAGAGAATKKRTRAGDAVSGAGAAKSDRKPGHVDVSRLAVGSDVQCHLSGAQLDFSDSSGIGATVPTSKMHISVALAGVTGHYHARLSLAECCDVCPFTGVVRSTEGLALFKSLVDASKSESAKHPGFRARVVHVAHQGASDGSKKGKKGRARGRYEVELTVRVVSRRVVHTHIHTRAHIHTHPRTHTHAYRQHTHVGHTPWSDAVCCPHVQVRPSELASSGAGELQFSRRALMGAAADSVDVGSHAAVAAHASVAGVVPGAWCWGVVESVRSDCLCVGLGGGAHGRMFILECERGSSASPVDQLAVLNDYARGRRVTVGDAVLCVVTSVDGRGRRVGLSGFRARPCIAAAAAVEARHLAPHRATKKAKVAAADVSAGAASAGASVGRDVITACVEASAAALVSPGDGFAVGSAVYCRVTRPAKVARGASRAASGDAASTKCGGVELSVQLAPKVFGQVCASHSDDLEHWSDQPFKDYYVGQVRR
jgi:hypothetical protein